MREPIYKQVEGGRWIWEVHGAPILAGDHTLATSPVSFQSENAAQENYSLHQASKTDGQGRKLLSEVELLKLLSQAAEMSGCEFSGRIYREKRIDGSNWSIDWNCVDRRCMSLMSNAKTKIQSSYNLLDE